MRVGNIRAQNTENVYACTLTIGNFYLLRPHDGDEAPFRIVRVKRVRTDADNRTLQYGAWVQDWELSTARNGTENYYEDNYHATQADGRGYRTDLP